MTMQIFFCVYVCLSIWVAKRKNLRFYVTHMNHAPIAFCTLEVQFFFGWAARILYIDSIFCVSFLLNLAIQFESGWFGPFMKQQHFTIQQTSFIQTDELFIDDGGNSRDRGILFQPYSFICMSRRDSYSGSYAFSYFFTILLAPSTTFSFFKCTLLNV